MEKTLQQILSELVDYIIAKEPETRNMTILITQGNGIMQVNVEQEKGFVKGVNQELKVGWISDIDKGLYRKEWAGQEYTDYLKPNDYDASCKSIPCNVELDGKTICKSKKL